MDLLTLGAIRTKLNRDLDLEEEQFVTADEMTAYVNEAIDDAEALIHGLYQDYFQTEATLDLVAGTSEYALPANIYGTKIKRILYSNGERKYRILRMKNIDNTLSVSGEDSYRYLFKNAAPGGTQIKLYPTPQSNESDTVTVWYIRNATRLVAESDVCDIFDFSNFIFAHVKWNVAKKERLGQDIQTAESHLASQRQLMEDTLHTMADNEENEVRRDLSHYEDFYFEDENFYNF